MLANRHACSVLTSVSLANNPRQSSCKLNYSRLIKWSLNCEWGEIKSCSHSVGIALFCSFTLENTLLSQICRMDGIDARPLQSTCWSVLRQDTSVVVYTTKPRPSHDHDQSVLRPGQNQEHGGVRPKPSIRHPSRIRQCYNKILGLKLSPLAVQSLHECAYEQPLLLMWRWHLCITASATT